MEGFLFITLILCFYFLNRNINNKFKEQNLTIEDLKKRLRFLQNEVLSKRPASETKETVVVAKEPVKQEPTKEVKHTSIVPEKNIQKTIQPAVDIPQKPALTKTQKQVVKQKVKTAPKKSWIKKFKEKNPDLEKFVGENLINKLGILILVLGISFFVKYAIDKDWINEPARVGIGILCGSLVMVIAHKLKKNYASFSSVLVAGAISIFYFTIYIAFHEYQLFSQTVAFVIMSLITAFSTLVSVSYNRQELAVLSLIGGFAAPFMLSTGEGNYIVLFTYIAILNIGILGISYFKKWKVSTILAFIFTTLLFTSWCAIKISEPTFSHTGALVFATLFYFIFSIIIVLNNLKNKGVFSVIEYLILIANTFIFFGIGIIILEDLNSNLTGLFTLLLAIYNLGYATILYKKFGLDKNAIYLLIGLALTFVTLTIPIQFEGNYITLFWAAEVVLLFWLSQKSKINSFKVGAIIVQVLTLISLLIDWFRYGSSEELSIIFNPLFIASVVVSISLYLTYWLLKKENNSATKKTTAILNFYKNTVIIIAAIITYFTGFLEINYQANQFLENNVSALSFPLTYHFVFISILLCLTDFFNKKKFIKLLLFISSFSILLYILSFYKFPTNEMIKNAVAGTNTKHAFYLHYIIVACLVYFGYQLFKKTKSVFNISPTKSKWLPWLFVFAIVYTLSNEIMIHGLYISNTVDVTELAEKFPEAENNFYTKKNFIKNEIKETKAQIIKIGYPILWGVFSFIFLIIGIKRQWKVLRVIALSLLGLTIVKLFVYDIKNVSETGKIVAFILLGVLILIISFVYQKIKKLVVDEVSEKENNDE
ncbi:DUF2339 domain-containing protein [Tenacibaculum soleae]|uniref:DUF2339 domain-containing protein n=1 Tax=Tenacibaculum soleae TaxID=447689 RepID=UPI0026E31F08|nr:DUF2339 domain-containing protein [Tenacibaculum soleae]MDO6813911.1 DUF2339 domain-containing protein [Tenacibaculum soleae]